MDFFTRGVKLVQALPHELLDGTARHLQLAPHPLLGNVQRQPFERFKKALGILLQAAQLDTQVAQDLAFLVARLFLFFAGLLQPLLKALIPGFLFERRNGRL